MDILLKLAKENKLEPSVLYTYDLKKSNKSAAVRFVYLMKGRGKDEGIVKNFKGKFLAPGCFTIPYKKQKEMQSIFKMWGIKYQSKLILID